MYLLIVKGQSAQKGHNEAKVEKREKFTSKYMSLIIFGIYRCDSEWQTVPDINNPACKTVSFSAGSPGLIKQSN